MKKAPTMKGRVGRKKVEPKKEAATVEFDLSELHAWYDLQDRIARREVDIQMTEVEIVRPEPPKGEMIETIIEIVRPEPPEWTGDVQIEIVRPEKETPKKKRGKR